MQTYSEQAQTKRYAGFTVDSGKIFEADTYQQAGDSAASHMERTTYANPPCGPHLAYVYDDNRENLFYRYWTYKRDESVGGWIGIPHATRDSVDAWLRKQYA